MNMPIDHFGLNLFNKHSCGHICGGGSQDPDLTDLIIPYYYVIVIESPYLTSLIALL